MLTFPEHLSSQPVFIGILVAQPLVFGVAFCRSLFVRFVFNVAIMLSVLQSTASGCISGIFQLFQLVYF